MISRHSDGGTRGDTHFALIINNTRKVIGTQRKILVRDISGMANWLSVQWINGLVKVIR